MIEVGPEIPLVILSSISTDGFQEAVSAGRSGDLARAEIAGKLRLYADIAAAKRSADVRPVDRGHVTLAFRHPDGILNAIDDVAA